VSAVQTRATSSFRKVRHVVMVLLVFAALGPPLGWLTFSMTSFITALPELPVSFGQAATNYSVVFPVGILMSYPVGIIPAIIAGLAVAVGQLIFRSFGILHVIVIGVSFSVVLFATSVSTPVQNRVDTPGAIAIVLAFLVPTVGCWLITRRFTT